MKKLLTGSILIFCIFCAKINCFAQARDFTAVRAGVFFDQPLRDWDGFGFNYVESAHFVDIKITEERNRKWMAENHPGKEFFVQEYGGFSILNESQKQEIINLIFSEDGLKPGVVKMFLDAHHQKEPGGPFDHETSTNYMREFVKKGLKVTRDRGGDLKIITTLYGPPGFMTKQKTIRGRDLDPDFKDDLALYMIDWVKFLKEKEGLPVKYLSLHNEGEDWHRWNKEGFTDWYSHDFNLYWSPEQVNEFVKYMPKMMKKHGLTDVGITNGEPSNWYRFTGWGYADFLADDKEAVKNLGLITTHGFYRGTYGAWFGEHNSYPNDILRKQRPELHSWVTSTSWAAMDASFVKQIHGNIYTSKVNAIIPWAGIQRPTHWVGGDPNPGNAIQVSEDGTYEVRKGYYFYKQASRAGQPGMKVARTFAMNSEIAVIGFAKAKTDNPDAFIVVNLSSGKKPVSVEIHGSKFKKFEAFRTVDAEGYEAERYNSIGTFNVEGGSVFIETLPGSVTTFFGKE
jgi:O-glycosyl hydrolase